jgi:hypothetical protein
LSPLEITKLPWYNWCVRAPEEREDSVRFREAAPNIKGIVMTKKVRIENADGDNDVKLLVELVELNSETKQETVISSTLLKNSADLAEFYIWNNRYLKVREVTEA